MSPAVSSTAPIRVNVTHTYTSDPKTVATAAQGTYGSFTQAGATLGLSVPLAVRPGTYNGTLTLIVGPE